MKFGLLDIGLAQPLSRPVGIFRLIGAYIGFAWRWATTSWLRFPSAGGGRNPLFFFLFLLFVPIGIVAVAFGYSLDDIDRWLDAHGGFFETVGTILFRIFWGLVLLSCVTMVVNYILSKRVPRMEADGTPRDLMAPDPERLKQLMHSEEKKDELDVEPEKPIGLGCVIMAVILGYFAWFGMTG